MSIRLIDKYPTKATASTSEYPGGSFKNETVPGAGDGTPVDLLWGNDWLGFFEKLIVEAGITPSDIPDTALASDYFDAVRALFERKIDTIADLRAETRTPTAGEEIRVLGYYAKGDGGGGPARVWVDGAAPGTYVDDGGAVIVPTAGDGSGAWTWNWNGEIEGLWYGIYTDATDSTTQFRAALAYQRGSYSTTNNPVLNLPPGRILVTGQVDIGPGTKIRGANIDAGGIWGATSFPSQLSDSKGTVILFQPTSPASLFKPVLPKGGSNAYSGIGIENLNIWGNTSPDEYHRVLLGFPAATTNSQYAFDFDEVHYSTIRNVAIYGFQSGIRLGTYSQRNYFENVLIAYCRNSCVVYEEYVTAFPTSDIWQACVFRTAESAFEQKGATSGRSDNIRLNLCQIEDQANYGLLLPRAARNWEVICCYGESIGIDTSVSDRGVFNIGGFGSDAQPNEVNLSVIGGQFIGSGTNRFLQTDETTMVFITNADAKDFGTLITTTANTRDYGIHITGLGHYSTNTFYSGPNNKLVGVYRSVGLDVGTDIVLTNGQFFGDVNASYTQVLGQTLRLGDSTCTSVNPGANGTIDLGIAGVFEWDNLYIVNAPTVSSDSRFKQQIVPISAIEKDIATGLKALIRKYKVNSEVERDSEKAQAHIGILAQDVVDLFNQHGLDAHEYGIIHYSEDADKYAVRYDELVMFMLAAL